MMRFAVPFLCPFMQKGSQKRVKQPTVLIRNAFKHDLLQGPLQELRGGPWAVQVNRCALLDRNMLNRCHACTGPSDEGLGGVHDCLDADVADLDATDLCGAGGREALRKLDDRVARHTGEDGAQRRRADDAIPADAEEVAGRSLLDVMARDIQIDDVREAIRTSLLLRGEARCVVPCGLDIANSQRGRALMAGLNPHARSAAEVLAHRSHVYY
mmetsp:Transcript_59683/g.192051  ORF Transcript_59683/g.192051 Transcript_59683/m.192051 type:complete len:213 (+) Transcript_59683:354-992(+)